MARGESLFNPRHAGVVNGSGRHRLRLVGKTKSETCRSAAFQAASLDRREAGRDARLRGRSRFGAAKARAPTRWL